MEDYHVAKFVTMEEHELGLFAIYDGHLGDAVPAYLQKNLFCNILKEVCWLVSYLHKQFIVVNSLDVSCEYDHIFLQIFI